MATLGPAPLHRSIMAIRAVALNPTDVRITTPRALWLTYVGRADEALRSLAPGVEKSDWRHSLERDDFTLVHSLNS